MKNNVFAIGYFGFKFVRHSSANFVGVGRGTYSLKLVREGRKTFYVARLDDKTQTGKKSNRLKETRPSVMEGSP